MNTQRCFRKYPWTCFAIFSFVLLVTSLPADSQTFFLKSQFRHGDFRLVSGAKTARIIVSSEDYKVVHIAASDFAVDVGRVTGKIPAIINDQESVSETAVIIGTIDKSPLIRSIKNLDLSKIRGKWESYIITTVRNPLPKIKLALVIAGSDRRGTAFGVYELSRMIGVSPWHWWADVTPEHRTGLIFSPGTLVSREPSVKYRGIFINDEDWGLEPWAAMTFEPETRSIGPKTYAKVFELLLRLKANTLWPAMHEVTRPFNSISGNAQMADDYAIVMGSSHAEPMLRNNVGEWKAAKETYNFVTNPERVTNYWKERVKENGGFENIYTIGMRGIHDSPILGTKSQAERIPLLEKIFSVQRGLIAKHVNANVESVPQIFCPYKEVLADYQAGLKVPDDVTIVFPDDNFGYIRQFPTAEEQKRKGGFGVYYHISYLGRPLSYLWLNSTPPSLIWQEMNQAYENGVRKLWILNVGDIKPAEIGMDLFLSMAYDIERLNVRTQQSYLRAWATREFGTKHSSDIAEILNEYYSLGFQRKPEHLQWHLPGEPSKPSPLTDIEKLGRLSRYDTLRKRTDALCAELPLSKRDAFYELVVYPVRSAALANERFFASEFALEYRSKQTSLSLEWARRSLAADKGIDEETRHFNQIAGGKWQGIMSPEMSPGQWPSMRSTPPKIDLTDFPKRESEPKPTPVKAIDFLPGIRRSRSFFSDRDDVVSIEAEHFQNSVSRDGFAWRVIKGLGKTGDSVSVFPARRRSFDPVKAPYVEYHINIERPGDFQVIFYLIPTQPLITGNGLRFAFSIDGGEPTQMSVDKDTDVSSRKWAENVLDQTTFGSASLRLSKGKHLLRIHGLDTGVILDKIVFTAGKLPISYLGPEESNFDVLGKK